MGEEQRVNAAGKPMRKRRWTDGNLYWPEEIKAMEEAAKGPPTPRKADPPGQEEAKTKKTRGASAELIKAVTEDLTAKVKNTKKETTSSVLYKNEEDVFLTTYLYIINEKFDKANSLRGVNFTELNLTLNGFHYKLSHVEKVQDKVLELTITPAYTNDFPIDALKELLNWFYKKFTISPANTTILMSSQKQSRFPQ